MTHVLMMPDRWQRLKFKRNQRVKGRCRHNNTLIEGIVSKQNHNYLTINITPDKPTNSFITIYNYSDFDWYVVLDSKNNVVLR